MYVRLYYVRDVVEFINLEKYVKSMLDRREFSQFLMANESFSKSYYRDSK